VSHVIDVRPDTSGGQHRSHAVVYSSFR
jgi:hypothetical protein